ncbi:MAG TPA: hypothetical protein VGD81_07235 [Opitutaceae bacterium]
MKVSKRKTVFRRCVHCGRLFPVNPRIGRRHRFCSEPECVRASHLKSQRKWRRSPKGREYFKGPVNAESVRAWRKSHPDYWRGRGRLSGVSIGKPLADALCEVALQDSIDTHLALLVGLIAEVSNLSLQDAIAIEIRRLMLVGHGILQNSTPSRSNRAGASVSKR